MNQLNRIDQVIAVINPQAALKRSVARQKLEFMNTGYSHHGASKSKKSLAGWISTGGSTKEDIDDNLKTLRERSRDLFMSSPYATSALKTTRTNVVGAGLRLKAQIDHNYLGMTEAEAREWEVCTEREFSLWADSIHCDAERMNNFYELQQIAFLSTLASGDAFAVLPLMKRVGMPYDLRVKIIEADRCCDPPSKGDKTIVNGVEYGTWGEVVAYHFANHHPLSTAISGKKEWMRLEKFGAKTGRTNVIHLMEAERPEQRRGVPVLAPVIESLKQLARYSEAELMAAVVSGMFTVFIESGSDIETNAPLIEGMLLEDEKVLSEEEERVNLELGNGAIIGLGEGEKANIANPGRPNTAFDGFVTSICRQIGAALEIPFELLVKHFTSSYSASRAALLEAWKMFRMRRDWFANDFCQPIYEEWLTEAVAKGRIAAPGYFEDPMVRKAYLGSRWNGPSQGQLDPLKEVLAAEKRVQGCYSTRANETVELNGGDFYQNVSQRIHEEKIMKEGGLIFDAQTILVNTESQQP